MSHAFYSLNWQQAMEELSEQIEIENPPPQFDANGKQLPDEVISWNDAAQHYACLYIRYLQIFRKLEDCYDQIVHPQKRRDIKMVLECVMARLCQVKSELVKFGPDGSQSDFLNLDELLLDLKLSPSALEVPIPRYFKERGREDDEENQKRDTLEKCFEEHGIAAGDADDGPMQLIPKMTKEQAIRLIQKNERGRQGMVRAKLMKELRDEEVLRRRMSAAGQAESDPNKMATLIQKCFRGHLSRIRVRKQAQEELVFVGMRHPAKLGPDGKPKFDPQVKEEQIRRHRKTRQADNELKYVEALVDLQQMVHDSEGPEMKDAMWDDRYNWWIEKKEMTGSYPDNFEKFYKEQEAKLNPPEEGKDGEEDDGGEKKAKKGSKKGSKKKGSKKGGKGKKGKGSKKGKGDDGGGGGGGDSDKLTSSNLLGPTEIVNHLNECVGKYKGVWAQLDESENYHQNHDEGIARDMIRPMVQDRIRKEVDVRLLAYLDNIKLKLEQQRAAGKKGKKGSKKGKKGKKGSKKGKKGKKGSKKGKGGKKGKKGKPIEGEKACAHMKLGDMISILVKMGVLQENRKPKPLKEYVGDLNYLGSAYQAAGISLDPSMAQIRQCIAEYACLPLGCPYVKENTPLINTLLLYGPHGSGKTMLTKAVAYETGATWFDLSPRNIERKLGSKAEIAKLVFMVFKVASELQPAVIYIDDVDKVWLATKGKKLVPEIVRMKNNIMAHKARLDKASRVLVVGNSRIPYYDKVDRKDLLKFFGPKNQGKMLFTPCPSYSARLKLWAYFISQTGMDLQLLEKNPKFDLNTLAYISEGYSAGNIHQAVQTTLPERRVNKILEAKRNLDSTEFISALSKTSYTYKDDYNSFQAFTDEVTGEKERRRLKELAMKKAEDGGGGGKGKKGSKKGKKKK